MRSVKRSRHTTFTEGRKSPLDHSRRRAAALTPICLTIVLAGAAVAAPVYQPPGANLTFGDVTYGSQALSAAGNPAAGAANHARAAEASAEPRGGLAMSAVAGLEFGNVDEFFAFIDKFALGNKPTDPQPPTPENPIYAPGRGIEIGTIIDICCPDLEEMVANIEREARNRSALLGLIKFDAYVKTFESIDLPVLFGSKAAGGVWTMAINASRTSKSYGVVDSSIEFDRLAALADLTSQYNLMPGDAETMFDIAGDVDVLVDASSGLTRILVDNDSALVTKAAQTNEISVSYGRELPVDGGRRLFVGAALNYYDRRLSRVIARFGDITDTEAIFDSIRNADFISDRGFGLDVGILWTSERFQLGANWTNINQPEFTYPEADLSAYRDAAVVQQLTEDRSFVMTQQLKLEASLFMRDSRWSLHFGVDANAMQDPTGDDFQWFTVSGGWTSSSNWLRNARVGYRRNLAGSRLGYFTGGFTAFKWFVADLAVEIDRVDIKDSTLPRGAILSLGFQIDF
jgi:hypothetical protein